MRIVLDTNVLMSAIFFRGPPHQILDAWQRGRIRLVVSPSILGEYRRVGEELARRFSGVDVGGLLELIAVQAEMVDAPCFESPVCDDPDDDMFLACAKAGGAEYVVTGDKALLRVGTFGSTTILTPRAFLHQLLR